MMNPYKEALDIKMKPQIYLMELKNPLDDKTFEFLLSLTEDRRKEKVLSQKIRKKAEHKLLSESLAKCAIKKTFGIEIKKQNIAYTEYGKPYLLDYPDIHFNVSHSGDCIVCAVFSGNVGIDIQKIGEYKGKLASRVCSKDELEVIEKSNDKALQFTKLWTRKEAYLKFLGTGIQNFNFKAVLKNISNRTDTLVYDRYVISVVW